MYHHLDIPEQPGHASPLPLWEGQGGGSAVLKSVARYIAAGALLSPAALHLVALSGGADSVALLRVLLRLGYRVEAAHCNFHLRGDESDRDECFCRELCQSLGVALHTAHFDTHAYAGLHRVSIEMAARELRYDYFRRLRHDIGAATVCVAHHRDDNAETLLLNLVRGTGLPGLAAIRPKNGDIVRPLLCVSHTDITDYLTAIGQPWVTDSTNLVADVKRNRLRLQVMPLLRELNPSVAEALTLTASHAADALPLIADALQRYESQCVMRDGETVTIDLAALSTTPSPRYLLFDILSREGFTPATAAAIYEAREGQTGRQWTQGDKTAAIDRGRLVVAQRHVAFPDMRLPMDGRYALPSGGHIIIKVYAAPQPFTPCRSRHVAQMDAASVAFPLTLRELREGDRFQPFGMRGTRLISDFLTDRKLSVIEKRRQLCLTDADGTILWLPGQRMSERCRVTAETTKIIEICKD